MDRATGGSSRKTHPEVWEWDGEPKASGGHSTIQRGGSWEPSAFPDLRQVSLGRQTLSLEFSSLMPRKGREQGAIESRLLLSTLCPSTDRPSVSITSHGTPGETQTLKCRADGFYPREIELHWIRGGDTQETESGGDVLPSGNSTYQSWVVMSASPQDRASDSYSCRVKHSSLAQPLTVLWPRARADGSEGPRGQEPPHLLARERS